MQYWSFIDWIVRRNGVNGILLLFPRQDMWLNCIESSIQFTSSQFAWTEQRDFHKSKIFIITKLEPNNFIFNYKKVILLIPSQT